MSSGVGSSAAEATSRSQIEHDVADALRSLGEAASLSLGTPNGTLFQSGNKNSGFAATTSESGKSEKTEGKAEKLTSEETMTSPMMTSDGILDGNLRRSHRTRPMQHIVPDPDPDPSVFRVFGKKRGRKLSHTPEPEPPKESPRKHRRKSYGQRAQFRFPHRVVQIANNAALSHICHWKSDGKTLFIANKNELARLLNLQVPSLSSDLRKHGFIAARSTDADCAIAKELNKARGFGIQGRRDIGCYTHTILSRYNCSTEVLNSIRRYDRGIAPVDVMVEEIRKAVNWRDESINFDMRCGLFMALWQSFKEDEKTSVVVLLDRMEKEPQDTDV